MVKRHAEVSERMEEVLMGKLMFDFPGSGKWLVINAYISVASDDRNANSPGCRVEVRFLPQPLLTVTKSRIIAIFEVRNRARRSIPIFYDQIDIIN